MSIKLYGHVNRKSPNSFKLQVALEEAGASYEYIGLDLAKGEQRRPDFLKLNAHGKVPVLADDDFSLPESDAILWYVADSFPDAKLVPAPGPAGAAGKAARQARARVLEFCDLVSTAIYPGYSDYYMHTISYAPEKRNAAIAEAGKAKLLRALAVIESTLATREYLAGSFSIADIALASVVHMIKVRLPDDPSNTPAITAWYARVSARPAWQKALAAAG